MCGSSAKAAPRCAQDEAPPLPAGPQVRATTPRRPHAARDAARTPPPCRAAGLGTPPAAWRSAGSAGSVITHAPHDGAPLHRGAGAAAVGDGPPRPALMLPRPMISGGPARGSESEASWACRSEDLERHTAASAREKASQPTR